jgi:hypothetical protein
VDFEAAYDGYLNFPKYKEKAGENNINQVRHLLRGEFKLPTL